MRLERIPAKERFIWGPVPAVPYYLTLPAQAAIVATNRRYGIGWPTSQLFFLNGRDNCWIGRQTEIDQLGLIAARRFFDPVDELHSLTLRYSTAVKQLRYARRKIVSDDLTRWTNTRLCRSYERLVNDLEEFWTNAIFPELMGFGVSAYLVEQLPTLLGDDASATLMVLASADRLTFFQQEECALLTQLISAPRTTVTLQNHLATHASRYNWLLNNYETGAPTPTKYFIERAAKLIDTGTSPAEQIAAIKAHQSATNQQRRTILSQLPDGEIRQLARALGRLVGWHDHRKGEQLRAQTAQHLLLSEFARRSSVDFGDLLLMTSEEVLAFVRTGTRLGDEELISRRAFCLATVDPERGMSISTNPAARSLYDWYQQPCKYGDVLTGVVASRGSSDVVRGIARVLNRPDEGNRLAEGEILVTGMTSPDYIDVIRRCGAIVTDVGGMTSHAAVVARELKKVCIVGTRIATKLIIDGDTIEVDVTTGIVRKIKL